MRRMYSQNELEKLVKDVFLADVQSGEIDLASLVAEALEVADLSEVDLVVKTMEQLEANWSVDIETFPNITGGTAEPIFCRVQKINQELHIIMVGKITNNTDSAITGYGTNNIEIALPEEISSKLYDLAGNTVHNTPVSAIRISYDYASASTSPAVDMSKYLNDVCMNVLNATSADKISVGFQRNSTITINPGDTLYLESRVSLDLI